MPTWKWADLHLALAYCLRNTDTEGRKITLKAYLDFYVSHHFPTGKLDFYHSVGANVHQVFCGMSFAPIQHQRADFNGESGNANRKLLGWTPASSKCAQAPRLWEPADVPYCRVAQSHNALDFGTQHL